jgi:plasmid maintenance system antidote protein VapI
MPGAVRAIDFRRGEDSRREPASTEQRYYGRSAISPEIAIRLTKAFGSTEETWLRMQLAYHLAAARKDEGKIRVRRQHVPQELQVH